MNIDKLNFSSSLLNQAKTNLPKANVATPTSITNTTPQPDKVELSKPDNKKHTTKYVLIGSGIFATVLLLANSKKIGKVLSKFFSRNKKVEINPNEIKNEINPNIPKEEMPEIQPEPPKAKIFVPFSEFKLSDNLPQHYFDRIAAAKNAEDPKEEYYMVAKYLHRDIEEMCKINPECKFKDFKKNLPKCPENTDYKEFFVKHLLENKEEFIKEYAICAKTERASYAKKLNELLDIEDSDTIKDILNRLASSVPETEYPSDLVSKILKKENKEELINTLLEASEQPKVQTAKALLNTPEQNYSIETMLKLFKEIAKSENKETVNLDPIIELFKEKEVNNALRFDVPNILEALGDKTTVEKLKPFYNTTSQEKTFSLFNITSEAGTLEQHNEFLQTRFKMEDKNQVYQTLRAIECNLSSSHSPTELLKNDTQIVLPFLKYTGQENKTDIEIIKKTIEILTEYGDNESLKAVYTFKKSNPNLPEELKESLDDGLSYAAKRFTKKEA